MDSTERLPESEPNEWRETVRDIYDLLHSGRDSIFDNSRLAMDLVALIEERHPGYFYHGERING